MYYIRQQLQKRQHPSLSLWSKRFRATSNSKFSQKISDNIQHKRSLSHVNSTTVNSFGCVSKKQPLEAPYTGPPELIKINKDSSKATVKKNNEHIIVSIQRLKPCTKSFDREKIKPHHLQPPTAPTEVYCYCQQPYKREMIKCCNNNFKNAWYHYDCVSLRRHPLTWFCPSCRTSTTKRVTILEPADTEPNHSRCRRHEKPQTF